MTPDPQTSGCTGQFAPMWPTSSATWNRLSLTHCDFYEAADGKRLHQRLADGAAFDNMLVWLDDLERFAGPGLSDHDLVSPAQQVKDCDRCGTIRTNEYELLSTSSDRQHITAVMKERVHGSVERPSGLE